MNESQTFFSDESFKQSSYSQEPQMYNSEDECLREYSMMQVQFFNHMNQEQNDSDNAIRNDILADFGINVSERLTLQASEFFKSLM